MQQRREAVDSGWDGVAPPDTPGNRLAPHQGPRPAGRQVTCTYLLTATCRWSMDSSFIYSAYISTLKFLKTSVGKVLGFLMRNRAPLSHPSGVNIPVNKYKNGCLNSTKPWKVHDINLFYLKKKFCDLITVI